MDIFRHRRSKFDTSQARHAHPYSLCVRGEERRREDLQSRRRRYTNPYLVVRAIIERHHQDEPKRPRGTTDGESRELADEYLDDDASGVG